MKNPFEKLQPTEQQFTIEQVGGIFACQECDEIVFEAIYVEEINTLSWKCKEGHISKIEDFD